MFRIFLTSLFIGALPATAHAHWGHVGEVAGHGHLIGLGAVVAAGAIAGVLGLLSDKNKEKNADADPVDEDAPEGETV